MNIAEKIAKDLAIIVSQVEVAIRLLDEGNTVPFIARYRKEMTQGLSDIQLRDIEEKLLQFRELVARRDAILGLLTKQNQLTPELEVAILSAETKARLEDLYLPYRPRRKTKAQAAREQGLEPLATLLLTSQETDLNQAALPYLSEEKGLLTLKEVLAGVQQILMEQFSEAPDLIELLRQSVWSSGILHSTLSTEKKDEAQKYKDYADYQEPIHQIPSHRALALFRGRREGGLLLTLAVFEDVVAQQMVLNYFSIEATQHETSAWLADTALLAWKTRLKPKLELEAFSRLKAVAEEEAIKVFSRNLRALLLAAPAGEKVVMGLDPGIRTGVKVVVVDKVGSILDTAVVYPFGPGSAKEDAIKDIAKYLIKYGVELVSIGNGTASRETEQLVAEVLKRYPDLSCQRVVVSEAGASVYSASALASEELPEMDVTLRGAVSIARRLKDPLAELVKIDPKAIGVGQYQHDVNQARLSRALEGVVQDCVNAVGVDINTASAPLLAKVAGLNEQVAKEIVHYRQAQGRFETRDVFQSIPRLGPKAFQQAAGFLRIKAGKNPLDASGVHPEAYDVVQKILQDHGWTIQELMGNQALLKSIDIAKYVDADHGVITLKDIINELEKPGRDPRSEFRLVQFKPGVEQITDLEIGMILEGVVSNVTNFGAFVDIGVHQDGLVHISVLANRYVSDPHQVLKPGDIVTVKVIEVDVKRRRIGLSMKDIKPQAPAEKKITPSVKKSRPQISKPEKAKPANKSPKAQSAPMNTAMADALSRWKIQKHD